MKYKFNFTMDDWIKYNDYYTKNSKAYKKQHIKVIIINTICAGVISTIAYQGKVLTVFTLLRIISVFAVWALLSILLYRYNVKKNIKNMLKDGKNNTIFGEQIVELTDEYIISSAAGNESKITWKSVEKYVEDKGYIYLFISSINAFIIPIDKIETDVNKEELLNFIKEKSNGA